MEYDTKIREGEMKHRVAADWFAAYDCTRAIAFISYNAVLDALKKAMNQLAKQIEPKVYDCGFLSR